MSTQKTHIKDAYLDYKSKGIKCTLVKNKVRLVCEDESFNIEDPKFNDCKLAILTGKKYGLFIVDIDGEVTQDSAKEFIKELNIEDTKTLKTKRGRHYYFRIPENVLEVHNAQDILKTKSEFGFAIDIRGKGGYGVVPPDPDKEWEGNKKTKIAPVWLLAKINEQKSHTGFLESLKGLTEGEGRHQTALRVIGTYIKLGLKGDILWQTVLGWNRLNEPPLPYEWLESKMEEILNNENSKSTNTFLPMTQQIASYSQFLKAKSQYKEPELTTGFEKIDKTIWGFQRQELIVVGAVPNAGKTLTMLKSAIDNIDRKKKILFFPTEASRNAIFSRIMSMKFKVNTHSLRSANLSEHERSTINNTAFKWLRDNEQYINIAEINAPSIEEIKSTVERVSPDIVYVDYLQHCSLNKESHKEAESFVMTLKELCKRHNCSIVVSSQVNARKYQDKQTGDWREAETQACDIRTTQALWFISDIVLSINTRKNEEKTKFATRISVEKAKDTDSCTAFYSLNKDELAYTDISKEDYYTV